MHSFAINQELTVDVVGAKHVKRHVQKETTQWLRMFLTTFVFGELHHLFAMSHEIGQPRSIQT